jgi:hypothetical protein
MRARQLIDGASFGPEALKAIGEAFDAAWAEIAGNFGDVPVDIDNARYRLANALLSLASEDSRDVEVLKRAALQRMALDYGSGAKLVGIESGVISGLNFNKPIRRLAAAEGDNANDDRYSKLAGW